MQTLPYRQLNNKSDSSNREKYIPDKLIKKLCRQINDRTFGLVPNICLEIQAINLLELIV